MTDIVATRHNDPSTFFSVPLEFDADSAVWITQTSKGIGYSSDSYSRDSLRTLLSSANDLSSMSPELEELSEGWPARYYLSAQRSSLLRPFTWDNHATVLEIGSGCGSITRFLGETFKRVIAVEGEHHRAAAASSRARDQHNVSVVCASYDLVASGPAFDFIFCVGVLEYSPLFSTAENPFHETLSGLRGKLRDDGALILAIENKLGLKYFSGAAEDHTAVRFDGVEGYRRSGGRGPRTLGRAELERNLREAGYQGIEFFYPFPDYKFPRAILSERAAGSEPQLAEFIAHDIAGDYLAGPTHLTFDQRAAWHEIAKNGLIGPLANSFLVVASPSPRQSRVSAPWDATAYNLSPRRRPYWTQTLITGVGSETGLSVERLRLFPTTNPDDVLDMPTRSTEPWRAGKTLSELATDAATARNSTPADIAAALKPWITYLTTHEQSDGQLPGSFLDAIPQNLVLMDDDRVLSIDNEFEYRSTIATKFVVSRGLYVMFAKLRTSVSVHARHKRQSTLRFMLSQTKRLGLDYGVRDVWRYCVLEGAIQREVQGTRSSTRRRFSGLLAPGLAHSAMQSGVRDSKAIRRARSVAGRMKRCARLAIRPGR